MKQRPTPRHPWWARQTGWYAVPLVAVVSLLVVAGVTSSTGAAAQTATPAVADATGQADGGCSDAAQSTPACFLLASSLTLRNPLGPNDADSSDSYISRRPEFDVKYAKVRWELWFDGAGQVRLHDLGMNRCMNVWPSNKRPWLDECHVSVPGDQTFAEDFYLRGVDGQSGLYRVVSARYPALCMTHEGIGNIAEDEVTFESCRETPVDPPDLTTTQLWSFSGLTNAQGKITQGTDWLQPFMRRLALEQCDADKTFCQWVTKAGTDTDAVSLRASSTKCVGPLEYNSGTTADPGIGHLSYSTGAADETASTQGTSSSVAVKTWFKPLTPFAFFKVIPVNPIQISRGVTISNFSEYSWSRKKDTSQAVEIPTINAGEWGWYSETTYDRHLPGTWTFGRGTKTQFTATYSGFDVPSNEPGGSSRSVTIHTTVNPPDAKCSAPIANEPAITAQGDSSGLVRVVNAGMDGVSFTTGAKRVKVSQVGRQRMASCPNGATTVGAVTVGLYQELPKGGGLQAFPGGSVIVNLATAAAGSFAYAPLPAPLTLEPNTKYFLLTSESVGGTCIWGRAHSVTFDSRLGITAVHPVNADLNEETNVGDAFQFLNMKVSS